MKRIALLTVLLLAIGIASGFAADPIVPIMSSITAEVQWGIDLDSGVSGFANTPTFTIYLPLITYGSMTSTGSGDFYGEIDLTNIEIGIAYNVLPLNPATGNTGNVTATGFNNGIQVYWVQKVDTAVDALAATAVSAYIVAKPWNMQFGVYAAPSMALGHGIYLSQTDAVYGTIALGTAPGTAIDATLNPVVPVSETAAILATPYGVAGTYVQYGKATDPLMITAKVLSSGDWTGTVARSYAFGADGQVLMAPLTIGFGAYQGINNPDAIAWPGAPTQGYLTVGLAQPMDAMKVAADVKADLSMGTAFDYELSADAFLYISAANDKDGKPQYVNWVTANVLYGSATSYNDLSVHFAAVEDATNGFVPGLGLKVEGNLVNIMHAMAYDVIANASYKVVVNPDVSLTPAVVFWYGQPVAPADAILHLIPSATMSLGMVKNTTLAVVWTGLDLLPEPGLSAQYGVLNINATVTW